MSQISNFAKRSTAFVFATVMVTASLQVVAVSTSPGAYAAQMSELSLPSGITEISDIATNVDGTRIVMLASAKSDSGDASKPSTIYTSSNSGDSWTARKSDFAAGTILNWVSSSATGQNLVVTSRTQGKIWTSIDYGNSWIEKDLSDIKCNGNEFLNQDNAHNEISMSEDGNTIALGALFASCIYLGALSGDTWSWSKLALPNNESTAYNSAIFVNGNGTQIWFSNTSNTSLYRYNRTNSQWTSNLMVTPPFANAPMTLAGSSDGNTILAAGANNYANDSVYKAVGGATTFTKMQTPSTVKNWIRMSASSDASKIIAFVSGSQIFVSEDGGVNWLRQSDPQSLGYSSSKVTSVEFSRDGSIAYASAGSIWDGSHVPKLFRYGLPTASTTSLNSGNSSVIYGAANTLTATISSNTATGTVNFKNGSTSITGCDSQTVTAGVATCTTWKPSVGTYSSITAIYSGDSNLSGSTSGTVTLTVTAAPLSITASSPSVTYGAAAPSVSAASYSGLVNGDLSSVVTGLSCTSTYTTTSTVGSSPSTSCSGGTASNYSISYVSGSVTIGKATPTLSNFGNVSKTYGASAFDLSAPTSATSGTWTYSSATTSVISLTGSSATVVGAGTSVITATFTPDDTTNYNSGGTISMTVTVSKPTIAITASSHTVAYGGRVPTITPSYSGFVNGENSSVVSGLTCSTSYTTTTSVGTTTSTCSGATASNYSFSYTSGVITISQGGQTNALTINSTSVTYGSILSLTTLGGSGSGANSFIVNSGPCSVSGDQLSTSAAGTCMVTATKAANGNYLAASSVSTAITVSPKGLTISGLTGVNKEFDRGLSASATGTPTLVGVVGSDDVLLGGTPVFTFALSNVANGITISATGYTLTGTTAGNYTLTQPTITANITPKAARVIATNTTVAYGATVTSGFTTSGLISPDAVGSASYTYTGTGTSTPPTAVGVYAVTPSSAVFSTGLIGNYTITYDTATVTILAKYTITYNANGGVVASSSTSSVDFVVGDAALNLPTPTRANYTFTGWYTLQSNGVQVTGSYTPTATATLWAHWVQNSLYGMGTNTKVLTITTLSGVGNTYSANAGGGTIAIEYLADALPAGTVIDAYVLSDTSTATSLIGAGNDYVMSLVLAWVATDGTVPTTAAGKAIAMTITNSSIRRGSKIYSVIGTTTTLLGTAAADGSAIISITDDPRIIIAITKPESPTGVSATSGENASTTVSWTAPSDGGSSITAYTATSNAGQSCTSTTTSCSVSGLTNGTAYTFTVTATNSIGTSDPSSASSAATPAAPVVTAPSSGGGGGSTYVPSTPTVDPAVAAAAAAKALADAKAAEEKAIAEAKVLAEKRAAEEAELLAVIKALQDKADADSLAAAKRIKEELAAAQLKAEEELQAVALKLAEEQRIAAEQTAAAKRITTVYSTSAAFKLNATYTKRLAANTKKIATGSTVTCIGYANNSNTVSYAKAKVVATNQAKALCSSIKKINPTLKTKSIVYPVSKAPRTTVNKKWIPVSYRIDAIN